MLIFTYKSPDKRQPVIILFLAATDEDRPKETLKFYVQTCWWGNISFITDNNINPINYFTQDAVNKGLVVFKHHSKLPL